MGVNWLGLLGTIGSRKNTEYVKLGKFDLDMSTDIGNICDVGKGVCSASLSSVRPILRGERVPPANEKIIGVLEGTSLSRRAIGKTCTRRSGRFCPTTPSPSKMPPKNSDE